MNSNYTLVAMNMFSSWLAARRKESKMLQSEVAKKAGVSTSYISTLERGQRHSITGAELTPDRNKVIAIAKALNANVDEALALCGYARLPQGKTVVIDSSEDYDTMVTVSQTPAKNLPELLSALNDLGIAIDWATAKDGFDNYTPEDFEELKEQIAANVGVKIKRISSR